MIVTIPAGITNVDVTIPGEQYDITATYTLPAGVGPFPLVVMSHGFLAERNQRGGFTALAVALAERGIASLRMDFAAAAIPRRISSITI